MNLSNRLAHRAVGSFSQPLKLSPAALGQSVIVPDVSFWQDRNDTPQKVNFEKMKANGAAGVILRAGQGGWDDQDVRDYWAASKSVFPRGMYWYYDSRYTPLAQAARVADLVKTLGTPEMEIWADFEESYGGSYSGWRHFAVFLARLQELLPAAKIGIYTGFWYWIDHSPNPVTEKASFDWFAKFPLWLAHYTNDAAIVKIPKPWTSLLYWQYTAVGDGAAYGVESKGIDLSYFNGTRGEFDQRYGLSAPPPPPTETYSASLVSIAPKPAVETVIEVNVTAGAANFTQFLTYRPEVITPPPPANPFPTLYRIKDDLQAGIIPSGTRPYIRKGTACTVRMQGANASVTVPQTWINWLKAVNTAWGYSYLFNRDSGWHNGPASPIDQPLKVETVLMGGNVIEVTRIDGNRAYFKCIHPSDTPPPKIVPAPLTNPLIHNFTIQYATHLDYDINGRVPLIVPMAPDGQEPWIDIRDLIKL